MTGGCALRRGMAASHDLAVCPHFPRPALSPQHRKGECRWVRDTNLPFCSIFPLSLKVRGRGRPEMFRKPGLPTGWLAASFLKLRNRVRAEWNMHPISLLPPDPPCFHQPRCLSSSAKVDLVLHPTHSNPATFSSLEQDYN